MSDLAVLQIANRLLRPGEERQFARASHIASEFACRVPDFTSSRQVDTERLLREEIFSRLQDVEIQALVQMMRDRDVNDVHVAREQLAMIRREQLYRGNRAEPLAHFLNEIA